MNKKILMLFIIFSIVFSMSSFSFASYSESIKNDILNEYRQHDVSLDYPFYKLYYNEYWASYNLYCYTLDSFIYTTSENNYILDNMTQNMNMYVYYYDETGQYLDEQSYDNAMSTYNNSNMVYSKVDSQNTVMFSNRSNILDNLGNLIYSYSNMNYEEGIETFKDYKFINLSTEYSQDMSSYNWSMFINPTPPQNYQLSIKAVSLDGQLIEESTGLYLNDDYIKTHWNNITENQIITVSLLDTNNNVLATNRIMISQIGGSLPLVEAPNNNANFNLSNAPDKPELPVDPDVFDYIIYAIKGLIYLIVLLVYAVGQLIYQTSLLTMYLAYIFNWLPAPITAILTVGLPLTIVFGVLRGK